MKVTYECHQDIRCRGLSVTNCVKKWGLSVTKRTKIEGLSVKCIKKKKAKNFSTFRQIFAKSNFLPTIVTCLTIKCENEGSLSDKDMSGSFSDKEFV